MPTLNLSSMPSFGAPIQLAGKSAIVTGSTSGIGLGIATAFAKAGMNVMLNGFGNAEEIEAIRTELARSCGVTALYSAADMSKPAEIAAMVQAAGRAFGGVDVLVNNAGIQHVEAVETFPPERWDAILAINLSSAFHSTRAVVPMMKARNWGRIINVASAHGLVASPFKSAYVAAKHGVLGFTKTIALETAEHGITVNAICPGYVLTPLVQKQIPETAKAPRSYAAMPPLRSPASPYRSKVAGRPSDAGANTSCPKHSSWSQQRPKESQMDNALGEVAVRPPPNHGRQLKSWRPTQTVLVLQGGGALGAYQAGVYEALHEAGIEPDWVIGTSIGAINASLIAGNEPSERVCALREFWQRMSRQSSGGLQSAWPQLDQTLSYWQTVCSGIQGFFQPNPLAFLGPHVPLGADRAGYYSTAPLRETLSELVNFSTINRCRPRLTVGAAHVRTSRMRYFDSRDTPLGVEHILASGALPPAFPAVRIDGELYWDGGILSNTPSEVVFDDYPRRNSLIFAVHMWNPDGPEPVTLWDVQHRLKDLQYSSRVSTHIVRQQQTHRLRHVVKELSGYIPEAIRNTDAVRDLVEYGCLTQMHVVRLLAPQLDNEDQTKDVDFSASGIASRWRAGREKTRSVIAAAPWKTPVDPIEGVILHELTSKSGSEHLPPVTPARRNLGNTLKWA
jgi:NTE family protein